MRVTSKQLDRIVDQIATATRPAGIILFGSYARGDTHELSDLDLLVIRGREFEKGESRRQEIGAIYRAISEAPFVPKDIILMTKEEFLSWKETTNHMAAVAAREGRLLYGEI